MPSVNIVQIMTVPVMILIAHNKTYLHFTTLKQYYFDKFHQPVHRFPSFYFQQFMHKYFL